jgi:uncharacterized protein YjgD (DUF1641 family)
VLTINVSRQQVCPRKQAVNYSLAKTPEAIRSVRNLLLLSQVLGKIEPELLDVIVRSIPEGRAQVSAKRSETLGLFSLLQKFCSKDSRRAMGAAAELLESVGKGLNHSRIH